MLKRLNFFFEFFEKNSIFPFYESLVNNINSHILTNENKEELKRSITGQCVCVVNMIPPYVDLKINQQKAPYRAFRIKSRTGFIIDLSQYSNAEEYLKLHLGSRHRKNILSKLRRLESCFDIRYKIHFGEMDEVEYENLFEEFEQMIRNRFQQRGEEHVGLKRWDLYKENVLDLILKKRASLFVIYDGKKPISINLNYHFENIMDSAITSYDIDYAKFGVGNIAVLNKLEWCYQNDYIRIDMRWGELPYKRLWCNAIEDYRCDVVYDNNKLIAMPLAFLVSKYIILKKLLLERKVIPLNFKFWGNQKAKENVQSDDASTFKTEDLAQLPSEDDISIVDLGEKEFHFLRNPVYNFQYSNFEHSRDVNVYEVKNEKMSYIITGKSQLQKLIF
ncbi:Acetyltransferase (GNAT) domain-containing protein [Arenibacter palladensis]|uniref:Acetyltransferase (GNAT) domain-containing protein n=1 Tax=Arenibacter palladensis TaxID=237373 RepID=A0A1M5EJG2_9FLAO|nr:GNAT family N-acetyltransferase [Arenibacter palladensis]SHF79306.1 Acetyltransferase (GNAT) domain-containing protein [Arenibacter palladensis]